MALFSSLITPCPAQWSLSASSTEASLRGLSAVSRHVAWAGGTAGTILRTIDGGAHWSSVSPPDTAKLDFRDIQAFDASTAWALSAGPGEASRLYFTSDDGQHWKQIAANRNAAGFWDAIAFWDRRNGLLLGDPVDSRFDIRITRDGGATWTAPRNLPSARTGESAFAASGTCLIATNRGRAYFVTGGSGGGRLFRTADWGQTWEAAELPLAHPNASSGAFSVAFQGKHGIVVGGDFQKPEQGGNHIAFTRDAGRSWHPASGSSRYLSAAAWIRNTAIAVGPAGTEISLDRGASWKRLSDTGFHAVSAARDGWVWAAGSAGRLARIAPIDLH